MTRTAGFVAGASLLALVADVGASVADGQFFSARAETFDARWIALDASVKQDRLAPPRKNTEMQVVAIIDPASRTTTLSKVGNEEAAPRNPVRELPRDSARKEKLPVGCDPSFSPVTSPSMAHITGRCLAARQTGNKFAELSR